MIRSYNVMFLIDFGVSIIPQKQEGFTLEKNIIFVFIRTKCKDIFCTIN